MDQRPPLRKFVTGRIPLEHFIWNRIRESWNCVSGLLCTVLQRSGIIRCDEWLNRAFSRAFALPKRISSFCYAVWKSTHDIIHIFRFDQNTFQSQADVWVSRFSGISARRWLYLREISQKHVKWPVESQLDVAENLAFCVRVLYIKRVFWKWWKNSVTENYVFDDSTLKKLCNHCGD